jgi:hypothetical protein
MARSDYRHAIAKRFAVFGATLLMAGLTIASAEQVRAATTVGSVEKLVNVAYGAPPGAAEKGRKGLKDGVVFQESLETGVKSALVVRFQDDTNLTMGASAALVVDRFVYDPDVGEGQLVISLAQGAFRFVSGVIPSSGVSIQTPSAIIAIRGTELIINVAANGATTVSVVRGAIQVQPRGTTIFVPVDEEQSVGVSSDGTAGEVTDGVMSSGDQYVDAGFDAGTPTTGDSDPTRPSLTPVRPTTPPVTVRPAVMPRPEPQHNHAPPRHYNCCGG